MKLEAVSWDDPQGRTPLVAQLDPQTAVERGLPRPSECTVVVGMFWARMGSPLLAEKWQKADGSSYLSGTESRLKTPCTLSQGRTFCSIAGAKNRVRPRRSPDLNDKKRAAVASRFLPEVFKGPQPFYISAYATPGALKEPLKRDLRTICRAPTCQFRLADRPDVRTITTRWRSETIGWPRPCWRASPWETVPRPAPLPTPARTCRTPQRPVRGPRGRPQGACIGPEGGRDCGGGSNGDRHRARRHRQDAARE